MIFQPSTIRYRDLTLNIGIILITFELSKTIESGSNKNPEINRKSLSNLMMEFFSG